MGFFGDSLKIQNRTFPKQGEPYTVNDADDLRKISRWAYGYNRTADLISANPILQTRIQTKRIHTQSPNKGLPIVYKGDVLTIPLLDVVEPEDIEDIHPDFPDEVVIRINNKIIHGFTINSIERSINSIADTFSFSCPYNPEDEESKLLDPYTFYKTEIFIDKKLFVLGTSESWDFKIDESSTMVSIGGRSKAGVLVDCISEDKKLDYSGQTFKQICEKLIKPYGVKLETPYGDTGIINKAKRELSQKIFDFIAKLAKDKGFILNSAKNGNIKLDRANINGKPILNLMQGDPMILDISAGYNGQDRFSSFQAISQTRGNPKNSSKPLKDSSIKAYRPIIFSSDNNEQGQIGDSASWERSRSLARSAKINVTISGWRDKENKIILENNIVTLYAPNVGLHKETKMLIEKITYGQNGKSASLSLVLPQAYTLIFPEVMPWQR